MVMVMVKPQSIQNCCTLLYISSFYNNVKNDFYNVKMKRSSNMKKNTMLFFGHRNVKNYISIIFLK